MEQRKITFEDAGQDFLWWIINKNNHVIDCGPFQKHIWVGTYVDEESIMLEVRPNVIFKGENISRQMNYVITAIEAL